MVKLRWLAFLLLTLTAYAQTNPNTATIHGVLQNPSGAGQANTLVRIQLVYCGGNNARVIDPNTGNSTLVSFTPFDVRTTNGAWTTAIYGSDTIWCGTVLGVSRWRMTPIFNGVSGNALDYQVQSGTDFNIDQAPLCAGSVTQNCVVQFPYVIPPPPPIEGPPGPQGEPGPPGPPGPSGGGGGANPGNAGQIAYYAANGTLVSGNARFTESSDQTTVNYTGNVHFGGTTTVDGLLLVAGPWQVDSPLPTSPIGAASSGRSKWGISTDGFFYISENAGTPYAICTAGNGKCASTVTVGGSNQSVQFNDSGALGGDATFKWDKTAHQLNLAGSTSGSAGLGVAAAAGSPNRINLPTSTGQPNAVLITDGGNPQQSSWSLFPYPANTGIYPVLGGNPIAIGVAASLSLQAGMVVADTLPTATLPLGRTMSSNATAYAATAIGLSNGQNGSNSVNFPWTAFNRLSYRMRVNQLSSSRYYMGLATWNSGSTQGTNSTAINNTVKFFTDTPNSNFIGFRFSATTDTTWKAVTITAGSSPSTTVVDTGVTADTSAHLFEIYPVSGGTVLNYYIDRVLVAAISTNIPSLTPASNGDAFGDMFFTGDNKNTNTACSLTMYAMEVSVKYP